MKNKPASLFMLARTDHLAALAKTRAELQTYFSNRLRPLSREARTQETIIEALDMEIGHARQVFQDAKSAWVPKVSKQANKQIATTAVPATQHAIELLEAVSLLFYEQDTFTRE